jgi:hypothetical protein
MSGEWRIVLQSGSCSSQVLYLSQVSFYVVYRTDNCGGLGGSDTNEAGFEQIFCQLGMALLKPFKRFHQSGQEIVSLLDCPHEAVPLGSGIKSDFFENRSQREKRNCSEYQKRYEETARKFDET